MAGALLLWSVLNVAASPAASEGVIWLEAESPTATNFRLKKRTPDPTAFFGGDRLTAPPAKERPPLFAEYHFETPGKANHHFWVRKFWYHGPFRWRFDDQPWQICEREVCLYDSVSLGPGSMSWIPLGRVPLGAGRHVLRIEMLEFTGSTSIPAGANRLGPVAIDCFVLSEATFIPRGLLPAGASYPPRDDGWFAFAPEVDPFDEAALDLRGLNHATAGERGFLTHRGAAFFFEEDEAPTRFWGVVVGRNEVFMDRDTMDHFARRLAKCGVNLVRLHDRFHDIHADDVADISARFVDHFNYFLAAMKREGIYVMLSIYYDRHTQTKSSYRLPDHQEGRALPHFVFIHPAGEKLWRHNARRLLRAENPYTGLVNAEDPVLAIVQFINEDNYFFHTFKPHRTIPAAIMRYLEQRYGTWLVEKYGDLDAARAAWGKCRPVPGDAFDQGRAGLYDARLLGAAAARERRRFADSPQRFQDQAQFLTEDLRRWMQRQRDWLASEIGYRGLVNGGNWLTADARVLTPLDKHANAACDVMDRHGVGFPSVTDQKNFYAIAPGDAYRSTASVLDPVKTPMLEIHYGDRPHINSEPKKTVPNRWRCDWIPLQVAYASLQGTDGITNFLMSPSWLQTHRVWSMATPVVFGQYPAAALLYRGRYLEEGPVVVEEHLALSQLYALKPSAELKPIGPKEWASLANGESAGPLPRIDPLSGYVGRVVRRIEANAGASTCRDLSGFIDRRTKQVASATGQLNWDWGTGLVRIDAPRAQGAIGFLESAGPVRTAQVTIDVKNPFAAVLVVSMDGAPIAGAREVLVQVVSEDRNDGWLTRPTSRKPKRAKKAVDMEEIVDVGRPPIVVRNMEGTVALRGLERGGREVLALDINGYVRQTLPPGEDETCRITLLPDGFYYLVRRTADR